MVGTIARITSDTMGEIDAQDGRAYKFDKGEYRDSHPFNDGLIGKRVVFNTQPVQKPWGPSVTSVKSYDD